MQLLQEKIELIKFCYTDTHEEECICIADEVIHLRQVGHNCSIAIIRIIL